MRSAYDDSRHRRRERRALLTQLAALELRVVARAPGFGANSQSVPRFPPSASAVSPFSACETVAIPVVLDSPGATAGAYGGALPGLDTVPEQRAGNAGAVVGAGVWPAIVEGSSEGVAVYDLRGRISYANARLGEMLGCERARLMGRSLFEIIAPESHGTLRADLARRRAGSTEPVMYDFRRADGTCLRANVTGQALTDPDGEFAGGVYRLSDLTAWSQIAGRFRQLYDSLLDGLVFCELDGRISDCNPAYARMLGYSPDELRRLRYEDLTPAKWHAWEARLLVERIIATGRSGLYEKEYRRKDGSVFPVELSSYLIRDERGVPAGLWGIVRDITARRQVMADLARAHAELRRSVRFLETLLEAIPTPVFYKDAEGRYLGCNRAFTEHTGVSAAALRGKTVFEVWPGAHAAIYHEKDLELLRNPARQEYEAAIRGAGGEAREVVFSKGVFRDEHGQAAGLVGAYTDVTQRKEAERAVRASRDYLQNVIDGMVEPLLVVDREYRIVLANAAAAGQQGAHVLMGGVCARCHEVMHGRVGPCARGTMECPVRGVFATGTAVTATHTHAEVNGTTQVLEVVASPVFDESGAVVQVIQSYRDVTARRAAEERARRAAGERRRAARLSGRQRTVLELVAQGFLNKQVAARLGIAERTVEDHRRRGMQILGVQSVAELVRVVADWAV